MGELDNLVKSGDEVAKWKKDQVEEKKMLESV